MRKLHILALILAAGLSVAACDIQAGNGGDFKIDFASGKATDTWSRTYKVPGNGRFELINVNGKITAEPTDGAELIVEGRRSAKASSDEAAKEISPSWKSAKKWVGPPSASNRGRRASAGSAVTRSSGPSRCPRASSVDLRTINGGVRLNGLSNEIHAKTTNGGVRGENITPSVIEASAVNGGVEFELGSPLDGDRFSRPRNRERRRHARAAVREQGDHRRPLRQWRRQRRRTSRSPARSSPATSTSVAG